MENHQERFDRLCRDVESCGAEKCREIISGAMTSLVPRLDEIARIFNEQNDNCLTGEDILVGFIFSATVADGRVSEDEYDELYPIFDQIFGEHFSHAECSRMIKRSFGGMRKKRISDNTVDIIGEISPELKDDIIKVCLAVCAVDGKIAPREKSWIELLLD